MSSWSETRIEALKQLWREGYSATQIAARLGMGVTRNAVLGKVHRMKLPGRRRNAQVSTLAARRARQNAVIALQARNPQVRHSEPGRTAPKPSLHVVTVEDGAGGPRVPLLDLKAQMCRWPFGDPKVPGFGFCGGEAVEGLPYCLTHARQAYKAGKR